MLKYMTFLPSSQALPASVERYNLRAVNIRLPRLLVIELIVIATGIIAYFALDLLVQFASIALIVAFAILVTYALLPAVNFLAKLKYIPRGVAILLVYLGLLAAVAGFIALISVPLVKQVEQLAQDYPRYADEFKSAVPEFEEKLRERNIQVDLTARANEFTQNLQGAAGDVASRTGSILAGIFGTLSTIFIVLFVSVYFLLSGKQFSNAITGLFPKKYQRMVRRLAHDYDRILGNFVRGQLLISLIVIVVASVFAQVIGLPYSVVIGVVAGVTSLIPTVGVFLGMVLPVIIAAFVNPILIPVFVGFFIVLNEIVDKIVYPRVVGQAVDLHPLLVFFGILIGVQIAGIAGALLATPVLALVKVTLRSLRRSAGYAHA